MSIFDGELYRLSVRFVNSDGNTVRVSEHFTYDADEVPDMVTILAARPNVAAVAVHRLEYVETAARTDSGLTYGDVSDWEEW
ncbi:hypothetical protein ADL27_38535 [Streptomyces sp. NRRL F-6602]|uniref:hypothetical protein n=1 Tax=Streptomyces sp. NRRL F-5630 TaxID=1463864 RepID=UPI0004C754B5|nr:hypothetical protein [Streptomyces sp. NRRL F-5630]KPC89914.1 hypothetical protein ADL27_38535 [Streptomyces sp. NRRL F-6602]